MGGQWLRTVQESAKTLSATQGTFTVTVNLPKTNFINNLLIRLQRTAAATHAASTTTIAWIDVVGNSSSSIIHLSGAEAQKFMLFDYANAQQTTSANGALNLADGTASAANSEVSSYPYIISFGRFIGDTLAVLPAKAFKSLQLKITYTNGTADLAGLALYVSIDELVSDDAVNTKFMLKKTEIEGKATGTGDVDFDLPLGNAYRRIMLGVSAATTVTTISLRANNGSEIPFTDEYINIQLMNAYDYELVSTVTLGQIYTPLYILIDLDRADTLGKVVDTANYNDLKLRVSRGSTTTTTTVIAEEVVIM